MIGYGFQGFFFMGVSPFSMFVIESIQENDRQGYMTKVIYTTLLNLAEILPKARQIPPVGFSFPFREEVFRVFSPH
jgi:hypothetical protein